MKAWRASPTRANVAAPRSARRRSAEDDRGRRLQTAIIRRVGEDRFNRWFKQAKIEVNGDLVRVIADTAFVAKWIETYFARDVRLLAAETVARMSRGNQRRAPRPRCRGSHVETDLPLRPRQRAAEGTTVQRCAGRRARGSRSASALLG